MTPAMLRRLALYKRVADNLDVMGKHVLELVRHPDTTTQQMDRARIAYCAAYAGYAKVRGQLQERHTDYRLPWNKLS
jgi:hypothetical protein